MSKTALLLTTVACIAAFLMMASVDISKPNEFESWKRQFGMVYDVQENTYRQGVFLRNMEHINRHNGMLGRTYEMGVNQFTALTTEEFQNLHLMSPVISQPKETKEVPRSVNGPTIDWQVSGKVTPARNQGSCPASYAFSAVGAVESMNAIFYRTLDVFSPQQVVDCSSQYGNNGCFSGRMDNTFNFIQNKGISLDTSYTWTGSQGQCRATTGSFRKVAGYRNVTDCNNLALFLATQPISVMVDGSNFQFYRSGIFADCGTNLNAALLLVGMNDNAWRLRNSWGGSWGEQGYIRFYRGNTCGLCIQASFPVPQ